MKSHYCHEEKAIIEFTGQCNWCGEKEINANELADELDKSRQEPFTSEYLVGQAATMLRQQQAEIEALKKQVEILSTAFETACDGLKTSLDLNKAQAERYWSEKK